jgi:hypothetical protein
LIILFIAIKLIQASISSILRWATYSRSSSRGLGLVRPAPLTRFGHAGQAALKTSAMLDSMIK